MHYVVVTDRVGIEPRVARSRVQRLNHWVIKLPERPSCLRLACYLHCCHAIATSEPRFCPVLTRVKSDTGKFSYVVLHYFSLLSRCSLDAATLSYAVLRCASLLPRNRLVLVLGNINLVTCDTRWILAHNRARPYTFLLRPSHVVLRHVTLKLRWRYVVAMLLCVAENLPEFWTRSKLRYVKNPVYVLSRLITFGPLCLTFQLRRSHVVPRFAT